MSFASCLTQALPSSSRHTITLLPSVRTSQSKGKAVIRTFHTTPRRLNSPPSMSERYVNDTGFSARSFAGGDDRPDSRSRRQPHTLHVSSTTNNIILTYSGPTGKGDLVGPVKGVPTVSGGSQKDFKKSNRASYEAAHQASIKMFRAIQARNEEKDRLQTPDRITIAFKGMFGQAREAVSAALAGPEGVEIQGLVVRVEDRTPIKIGGTRAPKARRL